jgi:transglutaminase-like putative cysteine protease
MKTACKQLLFTIVVALCGDRALASADQDRTFEGPFRIKAIATRRIRATVKTVYGYPNLTASEWMVAYPLPPEFDGQPSARASIKVEDAPFAEVGKMTDETGLRQPLLTLHWVPDTAQGAHGFTVQATYDLTITRRALEPGEPIDVVPRLTKGQRSAFLASSQHFDFNSSKFQAWLRKHDLKRSPSERDLAFAHRAMEVMVQTHRYRFELLSDRTATAVCQAGWSDCGGLSTVFVSILRANGIPARCLSGRLVKPDGTHVRMEFYADGVGWVPADPALALGGHSADAGFGSERADMVIMHFDVVRFYRQYCWLQGIGAIRSINDEEGSARGMTLEHVMTVEDISDDAPKTPDTARVSSSRKRRAAASRRNGP